MATPKTSSFLLSSATLLIGPMADAMELNVAAHSVGMVKNVQFSSDPQFTELTNGLRNVVVMSVRTNDGLKISSELYEFTPANLAYAAGLDGADAEWTVTQTMHSTGAIAAAAATTIVVDDTDVTTQYAAGKYLFIQKDNGDYTHIAKIASVAFSTDTTITLEAAYAIPAGMSFPVGSRIGLVSRLNFGGNVAQETFSAKIIGLLPKDNTPFTIVLPKIKITRGLAMAFASEQFQNMPFEFTPYGMSADDALYSEYGDALAVLFPR